MARNSSWKLSSVLVSNVLSEERKQQVIALAGLAWSLRRIERETGIRRETIAAYLEGAGVERRPPRGQWLRPKPASPSVEVITDSGAESTAGTVAKPGRSPSSSACEAYRDAVEVAFSHGRNAKPSGRIWQIPTASRLLPERLPVRAQPPRQPVDGGLSSHWDRAGLQRQGLQGQPLLGAWRRPGAWWCHRYGWTRRD